MLGFILMALLDGAVLLPILAIAAALLFGLPLLLLGTGKPQHPPNTTGALRGSLGCETCAKRKRTERFYGIIDTNIGE